MRTEFEAYYDLPTPEVTEISSEVTGVEGLAIEEILPADPRLRHLSPATRAVITRGFGSDVDEALYAAERLNGLFRHPPDWVKELAGPKAGWRSFDRSRC